MPENVGADRAAEPNVQRQVRDLIYETLVAEGRGPSVAELSRRVEVPEMGVREVLASLAADHAIVLSGDRDQVRMAHPFSAAPMGFVVTPLDTADDRLWWGGCAWDSFGMSAAMGIDVRIDTRCPQDGADLSYTAGPKLAPPEGLAVRFPRRAAEWWPDVVETCSSIRTFCSAAHAEEWTRDNAPGTGYIADARTVWTLAQSWYGDRLDADFEPHSREFNQVLLDDCGLTGDFWRLP